VQLLTLGNPKTQKGEAAGYLTAVLHLAPSTLAGVGNMCPFSDGCEGPCLNLAGRGGIFKSGATTNAIQEARKRRTRAFMADRSGFQSALLAEIRGAKRMADRRGLRLAVRLNGTSDVGVSALGFANLAALLAEGVTFYDYTKDGRRALTATAPQHGVHVTYSRGATTTDATLRDMFARGVNVAVVFAKDVPLGMIRAVAARWGASRVIDGDAHDLRFLDGRSDVGAIVALRAKGRARKDRSGFVVTLADAARMLAEVSHAA
jgi:hypothetical protein